MHHLELYNDPLQKLQDHSATFMYIHNKKMKRSPPLRSPIHCLL